MATLRYMAKDQLEYPNKIELGSVTQYAQKWDMTRDLVYDRLNKGSLRAYELQDDDSFKYFVDLNEDPQKRQYTEETDNLA